jgi:hypothetical protein
MAKIIYCPKCGQAIKTFPTLGIVKHYGYKRWNEPYREFLARNEHIDAEVIAYVKQEEGKALLLQKEGALTTLRALGVSFPALEAALKE